VTALRVVREPTIAGCTFGALYINDRWQCWTLEDAIREPAGHVGPWTADGVKEWKAPGQTAIPAGTYAVRMTLSQRFQQVLPEIVDVAGFAGVRLHAGNTAADTEGCLLVGMIRSETSLIESRMALGDVIRRLLRADYMKDPIVLHLENPPGYHLAAA
jgi:hypothetical protein